MLAMRELLGTKLGEGLGVPRAAVDVLIGKATSLDTLLDPAIRCDRVEYVRLLLDAGADLAARVDGNTPLESAIGFGRTQMVDLIAELGIVPQGLWTYAACGRLDLVQACFDAEGRLRPDAALSRPNLADFLPFQPRTAVSDDPEQIMAEAFVFACQHGRTEVVRWFLDRGLDPDVAPYFGRTGLVWAVMSQQAEVAGLLMERGADPARGDEMVPFGAKALVAILLATDRHDPVWSGNSTSCSGPGRAEPPSQVVVRVSRCWRGRPRRAERRSGLAARRVWPLLRRHNDHRGRSLGSLTSTGTGSPRSPPTPGKDSSWPWPASCWPGPSCSPWRGKPASGSPGACGCAWPLVK
jgi:ankyrin repeat protein